MSNADDGQRHRFRAFYAAQPEHRTPPLIVVDMGYSAKGRTCGLARTGGGKGIRCTFGECIEQVCTQLLALPAAVVVVEAVLSMYHDPRTGNPDIRGEFERGRGWYYGPGAGTLVAARRFLEQLDLRLPPDRTYSLAEAFLSNKKVKTGHEQDARAILSNFWTTPPQALRDGTEPVSPLIDGVPSVRVFESQ